MFEDAIDQMETQNYIDKLVEERNRYLKALERIMKITDYDRLSKSKDTVHAIARNAIEDSDNV